jgi:hypothetical protein
MVMADLDPLENYNYLWDDVWLIREKENEITSEWPKGPSGSELPSDEDQ